MKKVNVVVPNWNGAAELPACLDSLLAQTYEAQVIVVDNGSIDESLELLHKNYKTVEVVKLPKNRGFAGGVNAGIVRAMKEGAEYVALFNNDAVADKAWLKHLVAELDDKPKVGIATSKILHSTGEYLDSTGDIYTIWGLPYPRGRREPNLDKYDDERAIFGASGGASIYRIKMLEQIGLFDEDFFAYYEDVDLSFRAQLAGWKVSFVPSARVFHHLSVTSSRIKGFATYQTMKNLPWLFWKNVPAPLVPKILPRFFLAHLMFTGKALSRGQFWPVIKGTAVSVLLTPKKFWQRRQIQKNAKVSAGYISSVLTHDLPPNAHKLRTLRSFWWKLFRRKAEA